MTARMAKEKDVSRIALALTNSAAAVAGEMACYDTSTGLLNVGGTSTTLVAIGYFTETVTGDGTTATIVQLFKEWKCHWFDNDGSVAVDADDIGQSCYIKDGRTVSSSSSSSARSVAGIVVELDTVDGVLVYPVQSWSAAPG